jgi:hypothetical protein
MASPLAVVARAYNPLGEVVSAGRFARDAAGLLGGRGAVGNLVRSGVDVIGVDNLVASLVKHGVRLALRSGEADAGAMEEMLELMRERVPERTGLLLNGIEGAVADGVATVTASAVRTSGSGKESADYARFVEFGTKAGVRGRSQPVADAQYFEVDLVDGYRRRRQPARATRRSQRSHPGTPAQPFFFNSAREVLERRQDRMDAAADGAAADVGLS